MKSPPHRIRWHFGLAALTLCTALCSGCVQSNNYPVVNSLEAATDWVTPSSITEVKCVALDTDGDRLAYTWSATGGGISGAGPVATWVAPGTPGTYVVTVAVTDGKGDEVKNQMTLHVRSNHLPVIKSLTAKSRRVVKANTSILECVASDPDGDELTYLWEATGGNISGSGANVTWTAPNREGSYIIRVIVTNSTGWAASKELAVTVTCNCGDSQE